MGEKYFRISDFCLIKVRDTFKLKEFNLVSDDLKKQYCLNSRIENIVWDFGDYEHYLNKIYSGDNLIIPTEKETQTYQDIIVKIRQGFSFSELFGLHLILKDSKSKNILSSEILLLNDFKFTEYVELTDGLFWNLEYVFQIPKNYQNIECEITKISFSDIDSNGLLLNYPDRLIPLIPEQLAPDYINPILKLNNNHYLELGVETTERKTVEQSILDYFEIEVGNIKIDYNLLFGTDIIGYDNIVVSNIANTYLPISIGLDLTKFKPKDIDIENPVFVKIFLSMIIMVDGKIMRREKSISTNIYEVLNPVLNSELKVPETVFPIEIKNETVINNTIIEKKIETKIVPINQPIYVELISSDIKFEQSKKLTFDTMLEKSLLIIEDKKEQISILSKNTVDNKWYFDCSEINKPSENSTFCVKQLSDNSIIATGKILI